MDPFLYFAERGYNQQLKKHLQLIPHHGLQQKVNMVEATSLSLEPGRLPQLVRHQSKISKAEETRKKWKMIKK